MTPTWVALTVLFAWLPIMAVGYWAGHHDGTRCYHRKAGGTR